MAKSIKKVNFKKGLKKVSKGQKDMMTEEMEKSYKMRMMKPKKSHYGRM